MRILSLIFLVPTVFAQDDFGSSYLKNSKLCSQWTCLNNKVGLPDALPPKEQYISVLNSLLPAGPWQNVVDTVANACYGQRKRRYTNTCPGQALMQCVVDNLVDNCPEEFLKKDDACAPVTSLAGFKYLFSQSRYHDLEKNLPKEVRPSWFLKNYFNKKCCDLPQLFNSTSLKECGVSTFMYYYNHEPRDKTVSPFKRTSTPVDSATKKSPIFGSGKGNGLHVVDLATVKDDRLDMDLDPLSCCDMGDFVSPSMRSECDFELRLDDDHLLVLRNGTETTTTPPPPVKRLNSDVKLVPASCEKNTCVFKKLNIISESGSLDSEAFVKLLHNFTYNNLSWTKAKARVVTKCLTHPIREYEADCEINRVLGCVIDVLTENCPYTTKMDPCKHSSTSTRPLLCQINSSKYRPKNRRTYCPLPDFVGQRVLYECDTPTIAYMERVPEPAVTVKPDRRKWTNFHTWCKDSAQPMTCLMNKMGVLNKFNFLDYFKMKDYLKSYTSERSDWSALSDVYVNMFMEAPLYKDHCSSPRKMFNVLHSMLMSCPLQRRSNSPQCQKLFVRLTNTSAESLHKPTGKADVLKKPKNYKRAYIAYHHFAKPTLSSARNTVNNTKRPRYNPINYRYYQSNLQPVSYVDIQPTPLLRKTPLMVLPVYLRKNFTRPIVNDGIWRSAPVS